MKKRFITIGVSVVGIVLLLAAVGAAFQASMRSADRKRFLEAVTQYDQQPHGCANAVELQESITALRNLYEVAGATRGGIAYRTGEDVTEMFAYLDARTDLLLKQMAAMSRDDETAHGQSITDLRMKFFDFKLNQILPTVRDKKQRTLIGLGLAMNASDAFSKPSLPNGR